MATQQLGHQALSEISKLQNSVFHNVVITSGSEIALAAILSSDTLDFNFSPVYNEAFTSTANAVERAFSILPGTSDFITSTFGSGRVPKTQYMTRLAWEQSNHFQLSLPLLFVEDQAGMGDNRKIIPVIRQLARMTNPQSAGGAGLLSRFQVLQAPLGYRASLDSFSGLFIVSVGQWFRATDLLCTGASFNPFTFYGPERSPIVMQATLEFTSREVLFAEQIQEFFIGAGGF